MNAKAAAESSVEGVAIRHDEDGYCWLFKPAPCPCLLIATDTPDPDDEEEGDVMWRRPHNWNIAFAYEDWLPA